MSTLFEKALKSVTPEVKRFVDNSINIVDQIQEILDQKGITQRQVAEMLGKRESEISKWMSGTHNFTLRSISKIEAALGKTIIITPRLSARYSSKTMSSGKKTAHRPSKKNRKVKSS